MSSLMQAITAADSLDEIASAIVWDLHQQSPPRRAAGPIGVRLSLADGVVPGAVLVSGIAPVLGRGVVAAAVEDDNCRHRVVRYAAQATRLGVPLRVVHVWGEHGSPCTVRHHQMAEADLLLSEVLGEDGAAEREILHDRDAARALTALSREVALIVVAARSRPAGAGEPLGDTVRGLAGHTFCPLAVLSSGGPPSVADDD